LSFKATLIGPVAGACAVGDLLQVIFQPTPAPGRIVCIHAVTGAVVGAIGGIPGLAKIIECLQAGVNYEAHVDHVSGGRVDATVNLV
jgi:branched-subunit amino acid ABC-type transport system permease component